MPPQSWTDQEDLDLQFLFEDQPDISHIQGDRQFQHGESQYPKQADYDSHIDPGLLHGEHPGRNDEASPNADGLGRYPLPLTANAHPHPHRLDSGANHLEVAIEHHQLEDHLAADYAYQTAYIHDHTANTQASNVRSAEVTYSHSIQPNLTQPALFSHSEATGSPATQAVCHHNDHNGQPGPASVGFMLNTFMGQALPNPTPTPSGTSYQTFSAYSANNANTNQPHPGPIPAQFTNQPRTTNPASSQTSAPHAPTQRPYPRNRASAGRAGYPRPPPFSAREEAIVNTIMTATNDYHAVSAALGPPIGPHRSAVSIEHKWRRMKKKRSAATAAAVAGG